MSPSAASRMFLAAAIFNWVVAAALFFIPNVLLDLLSISPRVEQTLWVQEFAGLVLMFGIGYFWAFRDFEANANIIRLAVAAKSLVVLIGLLNVFAGQISWQFMLVASIDALFVVLFVVALNALRERQASVVS